ncbi:MAG: DUF4874 domain-containing protein, partial [Clostridiales Family XIII bacterium]|nr:DUF4874 domain-containing protein [Clostridiales Family XIII bacterium]
MYPVTLVFARTANYNYGMGKEQHKRLHRIGKSALALVFAVALLFAPMTASSDSTAPMTACSDLIASMATSSDSAVPQTQTFSYTPDFTSVIANPERGFFENFSGFDYLHPQDLDEEYKEWLADPEYDSWRFGGGYLDLLRSLREDGVTMLDANIYLNEYINTAELPPSFLFELSRALQVVREAGMKITLRIVYADEWTPMLDEANYLRHVAQIGGVVTDNADIVQSLSAGVLGPWGEWHSDDDYVMVAGVSYKRKDRPEYAGGVPTTDIDSQKQGARRYRLVKQLLDHTPDTIPVAIRCVEFLMEIEALAKDPPQGAGALTQTQLDRLGLHDDSFASYALSYTRGGGWQESFYPYWDNHKKYDQVEDVAAFAARLKTSYGGDALQFGETAWYPEGNQGFEEDDPLNDTKTLDAGGQL